MKKVLRGVKLYLAGITDFPAKETPIISIFLARRALKHLFFVAETPKSPKNVAAD
jgi:hypothetical protein